jgi:hypothetical protein
MAGREFRIGVDFDNTIVCYDDVFYRMALAEQLIPAELPPDKTAVRDHLRAIGREDRWTAMQGLAYGERMAEAKPFPGFREFLSACSSKAFPVAIISHRTRQPIVGQPCDLHVAAYRWIEANGFMDLVSPDAIHFRETRQGKALRIREAGCTHFIDDLPEFLAEPLLPPNLHRILFDPARIVVSKAGLTVVASWTEIQSIFDA